MTQQQAIALIDNAHTRGAHTSTRWADLGCGSGLFTHALASLLQPGSTIYAIDRQSTLRPHSTKEKVAIHPLELDFVKSDLAGDAGLRHLDGILMANSFHYVRDKVNLLNRLSTSLNPTHSLLLVEYDTDQPVSTWVPYPLSFAALQTLFHAAGYPTITKLGERPSLYGRSNLYAALITRIIPLSSF
jgi:trans-aconitate methyltransferase